jgi:cytoskeletal protein RodZ
MGDARSAIPDLAAIRNHRGISLREIAGTTKIRVYYLEAIEKGKFEKLPGGVYTKSYIRQYARMIDYDENEILRILPPDPAEEELNRQPSSEQLRRPLLWRILHFAWLSMAGGAAESKRIG